MEFFTYAKLMLMSDEDIAGIQPDYIILDEFHRCGAEMWGEGVQKLLSLYPKVPESYYVDRLRLNSWISSQRVLFHDGKLSEERKLKLDSIGMNWTPRATRQ